MLQATASAASDGMRESCRTLHPSPERGGWTAEGRPGGDAARAPVTWSPTRPRYARPPSPCGGGMETVGCADRTNISALLGGAPLHQRGGGLVIALLARQQVLEADEVVVVVERQQMLLAG